MYDINNIFAQIIRGEIPCNKKIIENDYALSFYDINPMFEKHALIIPRGEYTDILDFTKNASPAEQLGFWQCFTQTAEELGIDTQFNVMANTGTDAPFIKQTVLHFHLHLVAGDKTPLFYEALEALGE